MERDQETAESLSANLNSTTISTLFHDIFDQGEEKVAPCELGITHRVPWDGIRLSIDERFQPKWLNGVELKLLERASNSKVIELLKSKSFYTTDAFKEHCGGCSDLNIRVVTAFKRALTATHTSALAEIDKQIQEVKSGLEVDTTPSMAPRIASNPSTSPIHLARAKLDTWSAARSAEENAFSSTINEIDEFISEEKELQHELDANAHEINEKVSEHERKVATSIEYNIELLDEVVNAFSTWHHQHGLPPEYVTRGGGWLSREQVVHHPQHCIGCDGSELTSGTFVEHTRDIGQELRLEEDLDESVDAARPTSTRVRVKDFRCKCKAFQIWFKSDPNQLINAAIRGIGSTLMTVQNEKDEAGAASHNVQQPQNVQEEFQGILETLRALYT